MEQLTIDTVGKLTHSSSREEIPFVKWEVWCEAVTVDQAKQNLLKLLREMDFDTQLAYSIVCPTCNAVIGGKCLDPVRDGCQYRSDPHPERIEASKNVV